MKEGMMDSAITMNSILAVVGILVGIVAGIGAVATLYKYITENHDRVQKWDEYDSKIKQSNEKLDAMKLEMDAKMQELRAEQCIMTFAMRAVLDGLHQLNCNGKVTEAKDKLDEYLNEKAHEVK